MAITATPCALAGDDSIDSAKYSRHTYYGTGQDDEALAAIRQKYGLGSDSEAIRFALRLVARGVVHINVEGNVLTMGYQAR